MLANITIFKQASILPEDLNIMAGDVVIDYQLIETFIKFLNKKFQNKK